MKRTSIFLASFLMATSAIGHSFYGIECCSQKDCKPIPAGEVKATAEGWEVATTGEIIPYNSYKIKKSPDGNFHRCAMSANFGANGHTLCLYVPPQLG